MSLEIAVDEDEKLLAPYDDVEWVDDVAQYRCTRCHKVLVQHYISNCEHKFCLNCKSVLDDGSHRWRCPECKQFILDMGRQDFEFKKRVGRLRLHCPHRKYGCEHVCPFKDLKEHLKECEHTRESVLPVPYEGNITCEMLDRMFTMQMLELKNEMKMMRQEVREMKMCINREVSEEQKGVNESAWELNIIVNEMTREMEEMRKKQKEGKGKIKTKLFLINNRVDGVKSDLHVETTRLRNEMIELKKQPMKSESLALIVEENKAKILKLEGKTETWFEIMDGNYRKNNDLAHDLKNKLKNELKTNTTKLESEMERFQQIMNEMEIASDKKWVETNEKVGEVIDTLKVEMEKRNSSQINTLNAQIESLGKDLTNKQTQCTNEIEKCFVEINDLNLKENINETNRKIQLINEENSKITQQIEIIKEEIEKLTKNHTENVNQLLEYQGPSNSCDENSILEQKVLQMEILFLLKNPQMNMFTLAEGDGNIQQDFNFRVMGIKSRLPQSSFEDTSRVFKWTGYPINAEIKARVSSGVKVDLSLRLSGGITTGMNVIPQVYYVIKYQTEKCHPKHLYATKSYEFTTKFNHSLTFATQIILSHNYFNSLAYVGDMFDVDIYVEPPSMALQVHSNTGTLSWAIDNYQKRKHMATGVLVQRKHMLIDYSLRYHESPYFYTDPRGYRVQVRMELGQGLKVEIRFLTGEFDAELPTTFWHQTTITLFNRKNPPRNITKTVKQNIHTNKFYSVVLCNDKEIEDVIDNDHIFYRVTITSS